MRPCRITQSTGPGEAPFRTERFFYDAEGRVTRVDITVMSSTGTRVIEYDSGGRPTVSRLEGDEIHYTYDDDGRLSSWITTASGETLRRQSATYGPEGPVVLQMSNADGLVERVAFEYSAGILSTHVHYDGRRMRDASLPGDGLTQTVRYRYHQRDRLVSLDGPRGPRRLAYDDAGRVTEVSRSGHTHARFEYDAEGRLVVEDARPIDHEGYVAYEYGCDPTD